MRWLNNRAAEWGLRTGERYPGASVAVAVSLSLVGAALAIAAIVRNWDRVDRPGLLVLVAAVSALALAGLWLWVYRSAFSAPTWLSLPVWLVPGAAVGIALKPEQFSATMSVLAYAFLLPYLLACAAFSIAGYIRGRKLPPEDRRRNGLRALGWLGMRDG